MIMFKTKKSHLRSQKKVLPSIHKFLFEVQVLSHSQLLNNQSVDVNSDVFPNTRPWTDSKSHPWRQNNSFLY